MKIVVIGGAGLMGTRLVDRLRGKGHEVVAASPGTGVDPTAGEGLAKAPAGAQVVVDAASSPALEANVSSSNATGDHPCSVDSSAQAPWRSFP